MSLAKGADVNSNIMIVVHPVHRKFEVARLRSADDQQTCTGCIHFCVVLGRWRSLVEMTLLFKAAFLPVF